VGGGCKKTDWSVFYGIVELVPKVSEQARQTPRGDLLEAGWRCLRQTTFPQLTVDQLCAAAGVSKGAFYGHFQSKQDFLLALLEQDSADLDEAMERMEGSETNAVRRLRGFARTMLSRDRGRAQVRADLWSEMPSQAAVRALLATKVAARRGRLRAWVEEVARAIGRVEPDRITWEWTVSRRSGRTRIDYTQNIIAKTLAAPYSLRPLPGAPVSTPLAWEELEDRRLRPDRWTIGSIWDRLDALGDLFAGVLDGDQELPPPGGGAGLRG
jgi:AcrR family transcriptional regulator